MPKPPRRTSRQILLETSLAAASGSIEPSASTNHMASCPRDGLAKRTIVEVHAPSPTGGPMHNLMGSMARPSHCRKPALSTTASAIAGGTPASIKDSPMMQAWR